MDWQRWNSLLARSHRFAKTRWLAWFGRRATAAIAWPKFASLWLRSDDSRHVVVGLAARRRRREISGAFGCQHRPRSWIHAHQRQRSVPRPEHRLHDQHSVGSLHNDTRQTLPIPHDQRFLVRVPGSNYNWRPSIDGDCNRRRARSSGQRQHHHLLLRQVRAVIHLLVMIYYALIEIWSLRDFMKSCECQPRPNDVNRNLPHNNSGPRIETISYLSRVIYLKFIASAVTCFTTCGKAQKAWRDGKK